MDLIQKLAQCDLGHEVYHSDGFGHVQVEIVSAYGFETPSVLLGKIDEASLWSEFFEMAKSKPESWMFDLSRHFPADKLYSTKCFVEFLHMISDRNGLICLIQESPYWCWELQNISLMDQVLEIVDRLIDATAPDSLGGEIDLVMLTQIHERLESRRSALESLPL